MHLLKERQRRNKILIVVGLLIVSIWNVAQSPSSPLAIHSPCFLKMGARGMVGQNSFMALSSQFIKEKSLGSRVVTGYSSTVDQCDSTPFITASGQRTRVGIVATNALPFGTMIRIDGLPRPYEVQDRMNGRYQNGEIDIYFPTREEALGWGRQVREIIQLN